MSEVVGGVLLLLVFSATVIGTFAIMKDELEKRYEEARAMKVKPLLEYLSSVISSLGPEERREVSISHPARLRKDGDSLVYDLGRAFQFFAMSGDGWAISSGRRMECERVVIGGTNYIIMDNGKFSITLYDYPAESSITRIIREMSYNGTSVGFSYDSLEVGGTSTGWTDVLFTPFFCRATYRFSNGRAVSIEVWQNSDFVVMKA